MAEWRMRSNASEEQEDDNDEKDHSEAAGWGVSPALTVGPAREGSEESQDQDHDQDSSKHGLLLKCLCAGEINFGGSAAMLVVDGFHAPADCSDAESWGVVHGFDGSCLPS